jgi:hypothetical protein
MMICGPLTSLLCFFSLIPTHASGSRLILQRVSGCLAALHVVLVMCNVPSLLRFVLMATHAGGCPSDKPALNSSSYPASGSESLLILQPVSYCHAAHHVVLFLRPCCSDAYRWPVMLT